MAGQLWEVGGVAGRLWEVDGVADRLLEVDGVAGRLLEVDGVAGRLLEVDGVAGRLLEVDGVAGRLLEAVIGGQRGGEGSAARFFFRGILGSITTSSFSLSEAPSSKRVKALRGLKIG